MSADSSAKNASNLSAQAQKFGISMKKGFNGRPVVRAKVDTKYQVF